VTRFTDANYSLEMRAVYRSVTDHRPTGP
jgi:hypothetical protein